MSVAAVLSRVRHLLAPPAALCPHAAGRAKPRAVACARSTHCCLSVCLSARASLTLTYSLPFVTQIRHTTLDWQILPSPPSRLSVFDITVLALWLTEGPPAPDVPAAKFGLVQPQL